MLKVRLRRRYTRISGLVSNSTWSPVGVEGPVIVRAEDEDVHRGDRDQVDQHIPQQVGNPEQH